MSFHQDNPCVPLTVPVCGCQTGRKYVFRGTPAGTNRFTVNLLCGPDDTHDIALTLDVRFNYSSFHNVVILTHKDGCTWGASENACHFPFCANTEFEIVINVKDESFEVVVNEKKIANFNFRIKPDRITHVNVQGDVRLSHVQF